MASREDARLQQALMWSRPALHAIPRVGSRGLMSNCRQHEARRERGNLIKKHFGKTCANPPMCSHSISQDWRQRGCSRARAGVL